MSHIENNLILLSLRSTVVVQLVWRWQRPHTVRLDIPFPIELSLPLDEVKDTAGRIVTDCCRLAGCLQGCAEMQAVRGRQSNIF